MVAQLILRNQDPGTKPRYLTPMAIPDGPDVILCYVFLTGFADSTRIRVHRVRPNGTQTLIRDVQTNQGTAKEDNSTAVRMGRDLHVFFSSHIGDPTAVMEREIIPNVFVA
ncbi:MAG TPA: hypothetical protein VEW94_03515 [Chloroflexia bacterium]|nr:hypothetical protein [Chloroflexia bacterium]